MTDSEVNCGLDLPTQTTDTTSFCTAEIGALTEWLERLPLGKLGESSRLLFEGLEELNSCRLETRLRYQLLELIRPLVSSVCDSLTIQCHSQTVVLPPQAFQIHQLTRQLQLKLATGYEIVAGEAPHCKHRFALGRKKNHELTAIAVHRALTERTRSLFRDNLIYNDNSAGFWRPLHKLYCYAEQLDILQASFEDAVSRQTCSVTIEHCYLKALLLSSVRSNQLRPEDLTQVFEYMAEWVALTELGPYEAAVEDEQLVVDLDSDDPPLFNSLLSEASDTSVRRLLLVDKLLYHLSELLAADRRCTLSEDLIKHLLISWGSNTTRTFMRMDSRDTLAICVGLSNLHYFVASETEFEDLTRGIIHQTFQHSTEENPFLRQKNVEHSEERDLWSAPFHAETNGTIVSLESIDHRIKLFEKSAQLHKRTRNYESYAIRMVNVSPGGYGLEWPTEALAKIAIGDIVGIRETSHTSWSVGTVSWLRRSEGNPTQLGVKLISPTAQAFGARVINKRADADTDTLELQRVLFIPAIKMIGQSASLITPPHLFRDKQNLQLMQQNDEMYVRLTSLLTTSRTISQFEIEVLDKPWQNNSPDFGELTQHIDTSWNSM